MPLLISAEIFPNSRKSVLVPSLTETFHSKVVDFSALSAKVAGTSRSFEAESAQSRASGFFRSWSLTVVPGSQAGRFIEGPCGNVTKVWEFGHEPAAGRFGSSPGAVVS